MRRLARKTLVRHVLVAILAIGLVLGFAAVHAQFSPMHRWNRAFGDASLVLISLSFCLFGFILGVLADGFEKLQIVPMLILTPLTFLGGTFYSLHMLPEFWQTVTRFNPIVYLISGFRWAFYGIADIDITVSVFAISGFLAVCLAIVYWIFSTGYKLKN